MLILLNELPLTAQKRNYIGIGGTIAAGAPINYSQMNAKNDAGYKNTGGISFGMMYSTRITSHIDLETGIHYLQNKLTIVSEYDPQDISQTQETVAFLFFPVNMKYNFKKNFFLKGGLDFSIDYLEEKHPAIKDQTGLGFDIGFGKKINLGNNFILELLPQIRIFNLIPFHKTTFNDSYSDLGFSIVINYNL